MKALIIGIDSNMGKALAKRLNALNWEVVGTSRRSQSIHNGALHVDLTNPNTVTNIKDTYDVIYALAAMPNIALCENQFLLSQQINFVAQVDLAKHCLTKTSNYVFLSTAAVFDGSKPQLTTNAPTTAKCVYGMHKAMAEAALLDLSSNITIVRTSKVITEDYKLTQNWIEGLKQDMVIEPFFDLNFSPVSIHDITLLLQKIAVRKSFNILHISGEKDLAYSDLAIMLANALNKPKDLIKSKSYLNSGLRENMTFTYSSLDMSQTTKAYGLLPTKMQSIVNLILQGQPHCVSN